MELYDRPAKVVYTWIKNLLPFLLLMIVLLSFCFLMTDFSRDNMSRQQSTLEEALMESTFSYYALHGQYPEGLEALLKESSISYDPTCFVVEYLPNGANLLPHISVINFRNTEGGQR